ncbi:MAG: tetratricopeptide repeat protein [Glycocaulis sp.]
MRAHLSATAIMIAASASLAACATTAPRQTPQEAALSLNLQSRSLVPATADERAAIGRQDLLTQAAFWAEAYDLNPADREAAASLSRVLRQLGSGPRAIDVARQALALYPDDTELLTAYGMALTSEGRGQQAIESLTRVSQARPDDWRVINALGVALEQAGRATSARARFHEAMTLAPHEPSIVSNLALSYALAGEPGQAEPLLRRAMENDLATPQVRQNLALVLALQGRFDEAERVALIDSTPDMAAANMDYVRSMMTSPRRWDSLTEAALRR